MGQMGFCENLQVSAVFCDNLRFRNAVIPRKKRTSAKISENQRKSANLAPVVPFSLSLLLTLECTPPAENIAQKDLLEYFNVMARASSHKCMQ